jgi:hypothetical protein
VDFDIAHWRASLFPDPLDVANITKPKELRGFKT